LGCFLSAIFVRTVLVKRRVASVEILGIEVVLRYADSIGETLIVNDFTCAQELYYVVDVGVVGKTQNVVIGRASLLLCYYHVFAMFLGCQKTRKILILQGVTALFDSVCYLRLPCVKGADAEGG
jgi:hypothetical protein